MGVRPIRAGYRRRELRLELLPPGYRSVVTEIPNFRLHPWHGLETGPEPPAIVTAYIEITPFDVIKYELDKTSGLLKVDRPQQSSSSPPTLYGLIPRTYCGSRVAGLSSAAETADGDPLDICVFSERPISNSDIIMNARVIGGLRMIDEGEADDKIVGVLANDPIYAEVNDLGDLPVLLVQRLEHYFLTYKQIPGRTIEVSIEEQYGRLDAFRVIEAAQKDYEETFAQ
jgi:inorganic pyrophosphatase